MTSRRDALLIRGPGVLMCTGSGSAEQRERAAPRPGHESYPRCDDVLDLNPAWRIAGADEAEAPSASRHDTHRPASRPVVQVRIVRTRPRSTGDGRRRLT